VILCFRSRRLQGLHESADEAAGNIKKQRIRREKYIKTTGLEECRARKLTNELNKLKTEQNCKEDETLKETLNRRKKINGSRMERRKRLGDKKRNKVFGK
jgi:hypothetical protein